MASGITQRVSGARCLNRDCSYSFDATASLLSFMPLRSIVFSKTKDTLRSAVRLFVSRVIEYFSPKRRAIPHLFGIIND